MAVIKCVPPVPGLSTRAIGFTYESHALLFRRLFILDSIHLPPSFIERIYPSFTSPTPVEKFGILFEMERKKIWKF